jgi:hypothetical protein
MQCIKVDGDVDAPGWLAADRDGAGKSHAVANPAPSVAAGSRTTAGGSSDSPFKQTGLESSVSPPRARTKLLSG